MAGANGTLEDVESKLQPLRDALAGPGGIPKQRPDNLLVATWNIRAFGGLTPDWQTPRGASPARNLTDVRAIAEIVSRFDVVAIQETRENLTALHAMMEQLGPHWTFIVTDVGLGDAANDERLAFVYDRGRVKASGLVGEVVVPEEGLGGHSAAKLTKQFARSPYAVSFATAKESFTLVTLHVVWGKSRDRRPELGAISDWLFERASAGGEFNHNLIVLGDFNIGDPDDENWKAFTARGLTPPEPLKRLRRTIFDTAKKRHYYDQIAWFVEGRQRLTFDYRAAGHFDWTTCLLKGLSKTSKSWHISDHYPMWVEFGVSPPDENSETLPGRRFERAGAEA